MPPDVEIGSATRTHIGPRLIVAGLQTKLAVEVEPDAKTEIVDDISLGLGRIPIPKIYSASNFIKASLLIFSAIKFWHSYDRLQSIWRTISRSRYFPDLSILPVMVVFIPLSEISQGT